MNKLKLWCLAILSGLIFFLFQLLVYRVGIYPCDEGRELYQILSVLKGDLPYRDFNNLYGPLTFYLHAWLFKAFGIEIGVVRLSVIIAATLLTILSFFIACRIMPTHYAFFAALISTSTLRFPMYTYTRVYSTLASVSALIAIIKYIETKRKIYILLAAILSGIEFIIIPTQAIATTTIICLYLFIKDQENLWYKIKEEIHFTHKYFLLKVFHRLPMNYNSLSLCLGYLAVVLSIPTIVYGYLGLLVGFDTIKTNLIPSSFIEIFRKPLPFILGCIPYELSREALRHAYYTFLFWLPVIVGCATFMLNIINKRFTKFSLFLAIYGIFYSLQIYIVKSSPVVEKQTLIIPFILLGYILWQLRILVGQKFITLINLFVLFMFFILPKIYYTNPKIWQTRFSHPRMHVYIPKELNNIMENVLEFVEKNTRFGDCVVFLPSDALYYYLLDMKNPIRYEMLVQLLFEGRTQDYLLRQLKLSRPKYIIISNDFKLSPLDSKKFPKLSYFILKNYDLLDEFGNFNSADYAVRIYQGRFFQ